MQYLIQIAAIFFFAFPAGLFAQSLDEQLIQAAHEGESKTVLQLLRAGANPNAQTYEYGISPLMYAAQKGHLHVVKILLRHGAKPNLEPANGMTALIGATQTNQVKVAEYLVEHNAKINARDDFQGTPLFYAVKYGYYDMADMLLWHGANPNEKFHDKSMLSIAAFYADSLMTHILLKYEAKPNATDQNKNTPLMVAAQQGSADCVKLLLTNNAEINAKNDFGQTALNIAAQNGQTEIIRILHQKGADINHTTEKGFNSFSLAKMNHYKETARFIKKNGGKWQFIPQKEFFIFSMPNIFNWQDYFLGLEAGFSESRTGLSLTLGYALRPFRNRTWKPISENTYLQLREWRAIAYLSLEKRYAFLHKPGLEIGAFGGIKGFYNLGSYKATSFKVEREFNAAPLLGIYWFDTDLGLGIKLSYEYMDFKIYEFSPHHFNINFLFLWKTRTNNTNPINFYSL